MARRRNSRRRRRRGSRGFLFKLLSLLVICGVIVVSLTLFFKVDTVQITGEHRYTDQQILKISEIETGDNLFLMNKFNIAEKLLQKLPYIESVRISRKLPDTLLIQVTECTDTLTLVQEGQAWRISPSGKIVEKAKPEDTVEDGKIDGVTLEKPAVATQIVIQPDNRQVDLIAMLKAMETTGVWADVQAVHLHDPTVMTMDYGGRFTVKFLYGTDYCYKLQNLLVVVDKLEANETGTINLTEEGKASFIAK